MAAAARRISSLLSRPLSLPPASASSLLSLGAWLSLDSTAHPSLIFSIWYFLKLTPTHANYEINTLCNFESMKLLLYSSFVNCSDGLIVFPLLSLSLYTYTHGSILYLHSHRDIQWVRYIYVVWVVYLISLLCRFLVWLSDFFSGIIWEQVFWVIRFWWKEIISLYFNDYITR